MRWTAKQTYAHVGGLFSTFLLLLPLLPEVLLFHSYLIEKPSFSLSSVRSIVIRSTGKKENGDILTNGGRVLGLTGKGLNLQLAFDEAYKLTDIVNFDGVQFRTDIGKKALN